MNERGFIFPTALCLLILISGLIMIKVELYQSQTLYYHEAEVEEERQFLFLRSSLKVGELLSKQQLSSTGVFDYDGKKVVYSATLNSLNQYQVTFLLDVGEFHITATGVYDQQTGQLLSWETPV